MISIEELNQLGFHLMRPTFRTYVLQCEKGSVSVNYRRDTLRLGGFDGGRAFNIKLKNAAHLQAVLDVLLDDDRVYSSAGIGVIGGHQIQ